MTEYLYTPLGLIACSMVAVVFGWMAWRYRDADWLVIVGLCALTMLGGSKWASEKMRRRKR